MFIKNTICNTEMLQTCSTNVRLEARVISSGTEVVLLCTKCCVYWICKDDADLWGSDKTHFVMTTTKLNTGIWTYSI